MTTNGVHTNGATVNGHKKGLHIVIVGILQKR